MSTINIQTYHTSFLFIIFQLNKIMKRLDDLETNVMAKLEKVEERLMMPSPQQNPETVSVTLKNF